MECEVVHTKIIFDEQSTIYIKNMIQSVIVICFNFKKMEKMHMTNIVYGADGLFYQVSSAGSKVLSHKLSVLKDTGIYSSSSMLSVDDQSSSASRIHP